MAGRSCLHNRLRLLHTDLIRPSSTLRTFAGRLLRSHSTLVEYERGHRLAPVDVVETYEAELGIEPGALVAPRPPSVGDGGVAAGGEVVEADLACPGPLAGVGNHAPADVGIEMVAGAVVDHLDGHPRRRRPRVCEGGGRRQPPFLVSADREVCCPSAGSFFVVRLPGV
jgi:hypothetical protein